MLDPPQIVLTFDQDTPLQMDYRLSIDKTHRLVDLLAGVVEAYSSSDDPDVH